jgi:prophage DNA circulation protein
VVALVDLIPSSFRGVRFLVPRDSASEGRNSIRHLFPDSSQAYVEDNGLIPPEFTLTAILHGNNLLAQFAALRNALNTPGPGTLYHPWYGPQFCAVKGPWKVTREDSDSGVLTLEICFWVTGPAQFPNRVSGIAAQVTSLSATFVNTAWNEFVSQYGTTPAFSDVSLTTIGAAITDVVSQFAPLAGATGVNLAMTHLTDEPERFAASGTDLGTQMQMLFRAPFEDLATTYLGQDIVTALQAVDAATSRTIATADAIPNIGNVMTTADYVARASALYTYSTFVRMATVSSMAEAMSSTVYTTANDVANSEALLLALYTSVPIDGVPVDTANALAAVVDAAMGVLAAEELQLPKIELLKFIDEYPASILAYLLYEDDARTQTLVDLNLSQNPVLFERSADVLTGVG